MAHTLNAFIDGERGRERARQEKQRPWAGGWISERDHLLKTISSCFSEGVWSSVVLNWRPQGPHGLASRLRARSWPSSCLVSPDWCVCSLPFACVKVWTCECRLEMRSALIGQRWLESEIKIHVNNLGPSALRAFKLLFWKWRQQPWSHSCPGVRLVLLLCTRAALNVQMRQQTDPALWKYALHTQLFHQGIH